MYDKVNNTLKTLTDCIDRQFLLSTLALIRRSLFLFFLFPLIRWDSFQLKITHAIKIILILALKFALLCLADRSQLLKFKSRISNINFQLKRNP